MENKKRFLKSVGPNDYVNALNEMGHPSVLLVQDEKSGECTIVYKINEEKTIEETFYITTSGSTSGGTIESGYTSGSTIESGYTSGNTSGYTSGVTYVAADLGLPSGNLWSRCNIGATSETEVGYYFQWGDEDVITTSVVTGDNYKWSHPGCSELYYGKYSTIYEETLVEEDDTARIIMGENWCMPTQGDFEELLDNVTVSVDMNTKCAKLTSKKNGNYIIIPISGYLDDKGLKENDKSYCLWTSTFDTNFDDYKGGLNSFAYVEGKVTSKARIIAMPVRGIIKQQ